MAGDSGTHLIAVGGRDSGPYEILAPIGTGGSASWAKWMRSLDESNIQRLTRVIRKMSAGTQFIVITQPKGTEVAQALYGVTLQEPGVSKLVSMKFEPLAAPAPQTSDTVALAAVRKRLLAR